ncbi:hypothetical protein SNE40_006207 [Patella caerulea]|uniref:CARD domain-containing protein n=1 Tax=Patella caerulea TaxID=87958 RepID=A0AAN8K0J1_PATCE
MPCEIGELQDDQKNTIVANYTDLIEDIKHDPVGLARSLFQKRVFEDNDIEKIKREERCVTGSKTNAAAKLLDILLNSGDAAYGKFIEALKENGYFKTVRVLTSDKEVKEVNEPKDGNPEDRFGERGVVTEKLHIKVEKGRPPEDMYNKIRSNYDFLTDEIKNDYKDVMSSLFNYKAISEDDVEQIKREETSQHGGKKSATRELLDILLNRGEKGYKKFLEALYANKCFNALFRLEPGFGGDGSTEPGIATDKLLIGSLSSFHRSTPPWFNDILKNLKDLFDKKSVDSPRLRAMKDYALTNLQDVNEKDYVKTRALIEGLKILKSHHILGIIGAAGDGKTTLSMMIASQFIEEHPEYQPLLINDLDDLKEVNFEDDKYLYVIDDMYGKFNKLQARVDDLRTHLGSLRIYKERGKLVIIYIMRDYIYDSSKYQLDKYDLFVDNIEKTTKIFLHKSKFSLNDEEKGRILDFYRVTSDKIIAKIFDCFGFPSIVSLCGKLVNDKLPEGLISSHDFLLLELETFWEENKCIYATLLLVFCLHTVSEKDLKQKSSERIESVISTIRKVACKEFELEVAKCKINELSNTFIKYIEENYMKIFSFRDFVEAPFLHHLSAKSMECALQYCSFELLMALVRTNDQEERCILVRDINYDDLLMRCIKELRDKNTDIVNHPAFIDYTFLSRFLRMDGIGNLLHDTQFINLGDIRDIQESGNFLHYITLHGDIRCLEAALSYFHNQLPQLVEEKTDIGWDIIGLAAVSMHDPIEKINLLKEKKIGDCLALPHLAVYSDKFDIVEHISHFTNFDKSKQDTKSRTVLHNACDSKHDNRQIINFLIGKAFDVNARDESGSTPLHLAVVRGKPQTVSILISKDAEVNAKDNMGRLPIHKISSLFGGRTDVLNQLIQAGSLLHEADNLGRIPLLEVIANVDRECFELLINRLPSVNTPNEHIHSILLESTQLMNVSMFRSTLNTINEIHINNLVGNILFKCCSSVDKMRILHDKGLDFNIVDAMGRNVLHHSCKFGSIDTVRYLANEIGLNITQKNNGGHTPVFYAVVSDIDPIKKLKFLLSEGCSLHVINVTNHSLLHVSCHFSTLQTVEYLVNEVGLDVNHKDNAGLTPAMYCSMSKIDSVKKHKFMSSKGASLHAVDNNNRSLLHLSCQRGNVETVVYLVNEVVLDVNHKDNNGLRPAVYCSISNIDPVKKIKFLSSKGARLHAVDNNNASLLHASCQWGTIESVEYLVNEVVLDVNHKDNNGSRPAVYCSISNIDPVKKIKFLSSKGARLHAVDNNNASLLHPSCHEGTIETVEYLVNEVVLDVNHKDNNGSRPAVYGSISNINPVSKLKFLSLKGARLHAVDNDNMSLLHVSCQWGTFETVEYLVNEVVLDVSHEDNNGSTPAVYCSTSNIDPVKKIKFLSSKGASLHAVDNKNRSLLHLSCQRGNVETVVYLVNEVVLDVNHKDNNGSTPAVHCSISKIDPVKKIKFLSSKGASLYAVDNNYKSLLHVSCREGTVETVEYLVNEVVLDVNHKDNNGSTPAVYCSISKIDPVKKIKFLSSKGASLHSVDNNNASLLHASCQWGTIESVEYLVNEVVLDVNHKDNNGSRPAVYCSISNIDPVKKIKFLSSKGARLQAVDNNDMSLLYGSCHEGTVETVEYLVNEVVLDVNHKDNKGSTPAVYGSMSNIDPVSKLKFLSSKGARLHAVDNNNRTLLHASCQWGTVETVEYLVNEVVLDVNHKDIEGSTPAVDCSISNINPVSKLKFLSLKGARLHAVDNMSLLHVSCQWGTIETVEYLVNEVVLDVNHKDNNGSTPAVYCSISNIDPVKKIKFLSSKGASLHAVDNDNMSLLYASCQGGTIETVEYLVNEVVLDVNHKDNNGSRPAVYGSISNINPVSKLKFLSSKGASLHAVDNNKSLLHSSCHEGTVETIEYLVNEVVLDVNQKENNGLTPAMYCSISNINPISKLKFLASKGASLHAVDNKNRSLLHLSCQRGNVETVVYLVNEVVLDVNHKDNNGSTPAVHCSISKIDPVKKIKFLSSKGASLYAVDNNNKSLLHVSCQWGTIETVEYLVNEIGLDVSHKDNEGSTPAVDCSNSNINPISKLKFLSSKGASLHAVDKNKVSLLHASCEMGTVETVKYLVNDVGLNVGHKDNEGRTPAICCSMSNINPISKLKLLSLKGASLLAVDNNNMSLLHASCQMGTVETVEYLVNEVGLDVNHNDNNGWTPAVHCSISNINPISKLKLLSSKGACLRAVDNYNWSLLHASCQLGTVETVEYLVNEIGLGINHKDIRGNTPVMFCCVTNLDPVKKIKFLSSKGASLINMNLLEISCLVGNIETVKYLVNEIGQGVNQSNDNETPL